MAKQCKVCGVLLRTAIVAGSTISPNLCEKCGHHEPEIERETYSTNYRFPATIVSRYVSGVLKKFKKHEKNHKKVKKIEDKAH
jgi:hypothetical protein